MKKLLLSLTLAALCSLEVQAQFQLNAGDTLTFNVTPEMFTPGGTIGTLRANPNFSYWLNYDGCCRCTVMPVYRA
jgi:hypothetical protein